MDSQDPIVAFPTIERASLIEAVRRNFNPQAHLLAAHVTVVFPFMDDRTSADLAEHVRTSVSGMAPFAIALTDISRETDGYLFLNVRDGADRFRELHEALYAGRWARFRSAVHEYRPHVTSARVMDHGALSNAYREACLTLSLPVAGTVTGLAVFRVDTPDQGAVIHEVTFAAVRRTRKPALRLRRR